MQPWPRIGACIIVILSSMRCRELHLGVMLPITGVWHVGPAILPIIDEAIEKIRRENLLPGYNITYSVNNSSCRPDVAVGITAGQYALQPRPDVFIGPGCSQACLSAGLLANYWNIPIISYSCSTSELENRDRYATFARTQPFSRTFSKSTPKVLMALMRAFRWKRAAIVSSYGRSGESVWEPMASSVRNEFTTNKSIIVSYYKALLVSTENQRIKKSEETSMLRDAQKQARIIFILANFQRTTELIVIANSLGMLNGNYAFITLDLSISPSSKHAHDYEGLITLTVNKSTKAQQERMADWLSAKSPQYADHEALSSAAKTAPYLHDAILLYAHALNRSLRNGIAVNDGKAIFKRMTSSSPTSHLYVGMSGPVLINQDGNRVPVFVLENIVNKTNERLMKLRYNGSTWSAVSLRKPVWPGGGKTKPDDDPPCVFVKCDNGSSHIIVPMVTALGVLTLLPIVAGIFYVRKRRYERDLLSRSWIINYDDITPVNVDTRFASKETSVEKVIREDNQSRWSRLTDQFPFPTSSRDVGRYKGEFIAMKRLRRESLTLTRDMLIEMKKVRDTVHTNLLQYIGVCIEPPNICIISLYCHRGSLQEILANDDITLDWFFRASFANDIAMGMHVIHSCQIHVHGDLRSSKCLVDSRWVCKVADFGLSLLKANQNPDLEIGEHALYSKLFWRAPELLGPDKSSSKPAMTQAGDVFSFGIILNELLTREEPYSNTNFAPGEIIERVRCHLNPPFRPFTPPELMNKNVVDLMNKCWDEAPQTRPTFSDIKGRLKSLSKGKSSIVDNMLRLMENYTEQLESIVEERTRQLAEEKAKTDELLYKMLPKSIAESLKRGEPIIAESYSSVTIFFSDIVGFTPLAATSTPLQVVHLLNDLYTCFDNIIDAHDVYKIETIGDAYMVVSGLPVRNGNRHAGEIATMALNLLNSMIGFRVRHLPSRQLQLRIGIHTGSCVAGVVGLKMPRFCLFGDTVNYASRMESNGLALRIHVSPECKKVLDELGGYDLEERGPVDLKGKGIITTYFLNGKEGFVKKLPDPKL